MQEVQPHRLCVAPMLDWTDRHCRAFHRVLTRRALLFTEMITTGAILRGDARRFLDFGPVERPLALQLGGSAPDDLAAAVRRAGAFGYDEINLNVGCPSDRVRDGRFGACLMLEPQLVADCVSAMREASAVPVSVKCRIGVDDQDPEAALFALVDACAARGVSTVYVHARKAWLKGLSPKENREIPPLDYPLVARLKRERPDLTVILNGGLGSLEAALPWLGAVDGVMLGRAAFQTPALLGSVDRRVFGASGPDIGPFDAVARHLPYVEAQRAAGASFRALTAPMLGVFNGLAGARGWRRALSEAALQPGAGSAEIAAAAAQVRDAVEAAAARRAGRAGADVTA